MALTASLLLSGCGGPDCDSPEYGTCMRDFEFHSAQDLRLLQWLVGQWRSGSASGPRRELRFSPPTGGVILGVQRDRGAADRTAILRFEVRSDHISYTVHPNGETPGHAYLLVRQNEASGVFRFRGMESESPDVVYRKAGPDGLWVDDGRSEARYERVADSSRQYQPPNDSDPEK